MKIVCRYGLGWCAGLILACVSCAVLAAGRDDFPSCYNMLDRPDLATQPAAQELIVIVDQTVPLNASLKHEVDQLVYRFLQPGDRFTLLTFSAFAKDRYLSMPLSGKIDFPLSASARYRTSIPKLQGFDQCMNQEKAFVHQKIGSQLKKAFDNASDDLPKTELAGSLARFGSSVIARSKAQHVVVLVVSDMFENSSVTSFYSNGHVAPFNVAKALKSVKNAGLISDWHGADVYVLGAGFVPGGGYRSEQTLHDLEAFWKAYFKLSDAKLLGWGEPELMTDLH